MNYKIINIYKYYQKLRDQDKTINKNDALNILNNQIIMLKKRNKNFKNLTSSNLLNFKYIERLN